ncbi:MAG TPA: hypothetical protein VLT13_05715 [Bacteroidota bacterium]|nr:hypothetical protein [Bacteroidota bacterium]
MKSIWFFVGILLLVLGVLILGAGIIGLMSDEPGRTVLANLHPRVWWGGIMTVAGILFLVFNRKPRA